MRTMRIGIWQLWIVVSMVTSASFAAHIDGDATKGAEIGRQCLACHSLQPSEHLTGPSLAGIFGRQAGTTEGFGRYSDALRKSEITWNADTLDAWLRACTGQQHAFPGDSAARRAARSHRVSRVCHGEQRGVRFGTTNDETAARKLEGADSHAARHSASLLWRRL